MKHTLLASALAGNAGSGQATGFTLSSPDIPAGGTIAQRFEFDGFGCSGENKSPALKWSGAPAGTRAFAVTVYDPDAPTGSGWWHWMVINLPRAASQARIDYGVAGWGGVCPPPGDAPHRYIFTIFALKEKIEVPADATAALTGFMIHANSLSQASFTATYGRPKQ